MKKKAIAALMITTSLVGCGPSSAYLDDVKQHAAQVWESNGYKIVGYEGFQWGIRWYGTSYGGACVWYTLSRPSTPGVTYHGYIQKWGDEYHIYNIRAIDAKPWTP